MISHLSRHKEIYSNEDVIAELLHDYSTDQNIIWAYDPLCCHTAQEDSQININDLQCILPRHLLTEQIDESDPRFLTSQQASTLIQDSHSTYPCVAKRLKPNASPGYRPSGIRRDVFFLCLKWLELDCGEAPCLTSIYDRVSGDQASLEHRIGFLDAKLRLISKMTRTYRSWFLFTSLAVGSCYACDFFGDSLLIARINTMNTILDAYKAKFKKPMSQEFCSHIASVVAWNIFQMDSKTLTPPFSRQKIQIYDWIRKSIHTLSHRDLVVNDENKNDPLFHIVLDHLS